MTRTVLWMGVLAVGLGSAGGCSSSDGGSTGGDGPKAYKPAGNGQPTTEADACARLTQALDARAATLGCTATHPVCPQYLEQFTQGACYQYDDGTVTACVAYIGDYASCADFTNRTCTVTWLDGTTCEPPDAGAD